MVSAWEEVIEEAEVRLEGERKRFGDSCCGFGSLLLVLSTDERSMRRRVVGVDGDCDVLVGAIGGMIGKSLMLSASWTCSTTLMAKGHKYFSRQMMRKEAFVVMLLENFTSMVPRS